MYNAGIMKLEQIVNTPRLEREMELPEHFEAAALKERNEMLLENIERLDGEYNVINSRLSHVKRGYGRAGEQLENFKDAKSDFEGAIEQNKDKLAEKDVHEKSDVIEDAQLNKAEEVSVYRAAGQDLRQSVSMLSENKEAAIEGFKKYGNLNFTADMREESFEAMEAKLEEIGGSMKMLELERQDVVEALAREAAAFLQERVDPSRLEQVSRSLNSVKNVSVSVLEMWGTATADAVSAYGVEAVAKAAGSFGEDAESFYGSGESFESKKDAVKKSKALYAVSNVYNQMAQEDSVKKAHQHAEKIEWEKKQAEEVLIEIQQARLKYDCNNLLNIEDDNQADRSGKKIFYKISWEPRHEYNTLKKSGEEAGKQNEDFKDEIRKLEGKKPLFFRGAWKKKLEELKANSETLTGDQIRLRKGASEALERTGYPIREKVELPYFSNEKMQHVINFNMYTHDNYGRGYWGVLSKHPVKTIGDFLDSAEGVCREVLSENVSPEEDELIKRFPNLSKTAADNYKYENDWKSTRSYVENLR